MATELHEIVRIAVLGIDESKDVLEFARAVEWLLDRDKGLVIVATKLLSGQEYQLAIDVPANVDRLSAWRHRSGIGSLISAAMPESLVAPMASARPARLGKR